MVTSCWAEGTVGKLLHAALRISRRLDSYSGEEGADLYWSSRLVTSALLVLRETITARVWISRKEGRWGAAGGRRKGEEGTLVAEPN
eukprot:756004-Hanusia_phi.AAC.3